jgi:hypothetical protein
VTALIRFQFSGYCRSLRVLQPLILVFAVIAIIFTTPLGADPSQGVLNDFATVAALMFPFFAWAARGLLDTEPDTQRHLDAVALGPARALAAGLLAAVAVVWCLCCVALVVPVVLGLAHGVTAETEIGGIALTLASGLAATATGALTSRAIIPTAGASMLVLIAGIAAILLASLGPLQWISVPMTGWIRAAEHGSASFTGALPGLLLHTVIWAVVATGAYATLRRTRP